MPNIYWLYFNWVNKLNVNPDPSLINYEELLHDFLLNRYQLLDINRQAFKYFIDFGE
jgi:hypothetical protein